MESHDIFKLLASLCFVVALMGGLSLIVKKLGLAGVQSIQPKKRRLKIIESLPLDARRRLVLIQRDTTQHLVILGGSGETIVETNISPVAQDDETQL